MKNILKILVTVCSSIFVAGGCKDIGEPEYKVVVEDSPFEVRDYKSYIIAEVVMTNTMEEAGSIAFRPLFNFISGDNTSKKTIEMTAPVTQEQASEKIPMTAPVNQQKTEKGWSVSFVMPADMTMGTTPAPNNKDITIKEIPSRRVASIRYSGSWSEEKYDKNKTKLDAWIQKKKLTPEGPPVWARYDPPFTAPILRRNEILIPIEKSENGD